MCYHLWQLFIVLVCHPYQEEVLVEIERQPLRFGIEGEIGNKVIVLRRLLQPQSQKKSHARKQTKMQEIQKNLSKDRILLDVHRLGRYDYSAFLAIQFAKNHPDILIPTSKTSSISTSRCHASSPLSHPKKKSRMV
jgi:hypothetical protein